MRKILLITVLAAGVAVIGCKIPGLGGGDESTELKPAADYLAEVQRITEEVNEYVSIHRPHNTDPAEIEETLNGYAEEYKGLAAEIEGAGGEYETVAELALDGADGAGALAEAFAEHPQNPEYMHPTFEAWGAFTDTVYDTDLTAGGVTSDTDKGNKTKGKGYGWWCEYCTGCDDPDCECNREQERNQIRNQEGEGEQERLQEREQERLRDGSCEGSTDPGKGKGPGDGKGSGKGPGGGGKGQS
jgi:hypothetical protein